MKNKVLALLALLAMITGTAACGERATPTEAEQPATPDSIQTFEQEVERLREELNIPGLSVAVLQGQEVVFARGFGYADVENQIPATENTPCHIASLTKPFAAAIIMQLVEAGQLDLDDEMADILSDFLFLFPDLSIHGYASLCEEIIELGKDTSGAYAPYRSLFEDYRCDTEPLTVRHHLTHTSQGVPGQAYRYNGFLFGFLTQAMEQVSGRVMKRCSYCHAELIPVLFRSIVRCEGCSPFCLHRFPKSFLRPSQHLLGRNSLQSC